MLELISRLPKRPLSPTPLLFIHGAWHGAWCWNECFLSYFAEEGFAAHALSLRGHGQSGSNKPLRQCRIRDYVQDVITIAQQFERPPVVIGHSMGGFIVQKYLETQYAPAGVLMAAVPPQGVLPTTLKIVANHPLRFLRTNLGRTLYPIIETPKLAQELFFANGLPEPVMQRYFDRLQDESYAAFWDMLLFDLPRPHHNKTPLLVMGGTKDWLISPGMVEKTGAAYQTAVSFFDMGHNMMVDAGWEAVADGIIQWLKTHI